MIDGSKVTQQANSLIEVRTSDFFGRREHVERKAEILAMARAVQAGTYRIRAKVGDVSHSSWQKIQFENVIASTYSLEAGEQKWTSEKVVKVNDGKLSVRIFVEENNRKPAGVSQIVFQKAY